MIFFRNAGKDGEFLPMSPFSWATQYLFNYVLNFCYLLLLAFLINLNLGFLNLSYSFSFSQLLVSVVLLDVVVNYCSSDMIRAVQRNLGNFITLIVMYFIL